MKQRKVEIYGTEPQLEMLSSGVFKMSELALQLTPDNQDEILSLQNAEVDYTLPGFPVVSGDSHDETGPLRVQAKLHHNSDDRVSGRATIFFED